MCFWIFKVVNSRYILSSRQPFLTTDKRYIISFNGEIYNFLEIKKKVNLDNYNFKTTSDTEVIAALILKYGVERGLKYLKGMYAIAIYDNFENKLYLHKDLYGKKPLYYLIYKILLFSSEISQKFIKNIRKSQIRIRYKFFYEFWFL